MENKKLPLATAKQAQRLDYLCDVLSKYFKENHSGSDKEWLELNKEYHNLIDGYEWCDQVFEENGKKGIKDVTGKILVPAIYDDFSLTIPYYLHISTIPAIKDKKWALVKKDGKGSPVTAFEYHYMEWIYISPFYAVWKNEDLKHFAIMFKNNVLTPYELDKYYTPVDDALIVSSGNKKGMIYLGTDAPLYVSPEYDDICDEGVGEDFVFFKDGKQGRVTLDGRFVSDEEYRQLPDEEQDALWDAGFICAPES